MLIVEREILDLSISWKSRNFSYWDRFFSRKETVPMEKETILSEKERRWKTNEANKWNNVTIF